MPAAEVTAGERRKKMKELVNREMNMMELDNEMVALGYYSEDEAIENYEIIESGCIAYTKNGEDHDIVDFEVTGEVKEDERISATYVKVIGIR